MCWYLASTPDTVSSPAHLCILPPTRTTISSPLLYNFHSPINLEQIFQLIRPLTPAFVTINRIPIHFFKNTALPQLKYIEVSARGFHPSTPPICHPGSKLILSLFAYSPVPFVSEIHTISFQKSDTILDLLQRLITTCWVHPDKALFVITSFAHHLMMPSPLPTSTAYPFHC